VCARLACLVEQYVVHTGTWTRTPGRKAQSTAYLRTHATIDASAVPPLTLMAFSETDSVCIFTIADRLSGRLCRRDSASPSAHTRVYHRRERWRELRTDAVSAQPKTDTDTDTAKTPKYTSSRLRCASSSSSSNSWPSVAGSSRNLLPATCACVCEGMRVRVCVRTSLLNGPDN
jgi:hypothetical protein